VAGLVKCEYNIFSEKVSGLPNNFLAAAILPGISA
jgi:hypothetical protein